MTRDEALALVVEVADIWCLEHEDMAPVMVCRVREALDVLAGPGPG